MHGNTEATEPLVARAGRSPTGDDDDDDNAIVLVTAAMLFDLASAYGTLPDTTREYVVPATIVGETSATVDSATI